MPLARRCFAMVLLLVATGCPKDPAVVLADALARLRSPDAGVPSGFLVKDPQIATNGAISGKCQDGTELVSTPEEVAEARKKDPQVEGMILLLAQLSMRCFSLEMAEKDRERAHASVVKAALEHNVKHEGISDDEIKKLVCKKLKTEMPPSSSDRARLAKVHQTLYGCGDPGPGPYGNTGRWRIVEKISPIDDKKTVFISISSGEEESIGQDSLHIRCRAGKIEIFLSCSKYVGAGEGTNIDWRLDKDPPAKVWCEPGQGGDSLFLSKPSERIRPMLNKSTLAVQYPAYSRGPVTAVFPLAGLDNALRSMDGLCKF